MTTLTPKQENFCLAYLETGNASESYRRAYDAENMKPESINVNASKLLSDAKVALRIEELRAPIREKAMLTLESHLARLDELSRKAEEAEQFGPAITAETNRGKAAGLYTDKMELTGANGGAVTMTLLDAEAYKKARKAALDADDC
jgi:phage terminase small subunit